MTKTEEKMGYAMKKLSALLKTESESKIKLFLTLLCIAIIMFVILLA
jgi:diacylglycerol kinase